MTTAKLTIDEILDDVQLVLAGSLSWDGVRAHMTPYQILDRLPAPIRKRLIEEYGRGGKGEGNSYSAVTHVTKAAELVPGIDGTCWLDTRQVQLQLDGSEIVPGSPICRLYRLKE